MLLVHNGQVINKDEALVPIYDPALFADFRIYETLRVESGQAVFLQDHIDRIFNSARVINMEIGHSPNILKQWIDVCISANQTDFGICRVIIHGDTKNNQVSQVYIYPEQFQQPTAGEREQGLSAITFDGKRIYPAAKTISRLTQFRATRALTEAGAYEAILISEDGTVHEGVRANVFLVKDGKLITPDLTTVLPGIRRRYVIKLAKQEGIAVEERRVLKPELYNADEIFITSTIMELVPLGQIDKYKLPVSRPIYNQLYVAFQQFKQNAHAHTQTVRR